MKPEPNGFTILEIVLAIIVIAALGFAGWTYYQSNIKTANTNNADESTQKASQNTPQSEEQKTFECHDDFTITIPAEWHTYHIENGGNCAIASVPQSEVPPVSKLGGNNISTTFTVEKTDATLSRFVDNKVQEYRESQYPTEVTSRENIQLDNGENGILLVVEGGHHDTIDRVFFTKKDNAVIFADWRMNSDLANKARRAMLTIR